MGSSETVDVKSDGAGQQELSMRLYVSGATPNSTKAIQNLRQICERFINGKYKLRIIDIYKHPEIARRDNIVAVPTLIKLTPQPVRVLIGNLSSIVQVVAAITGEGST